MFSSLTDTHSSMRDGQWVFISRKSLSWYILYKEKGEFSQFSICLHSFDIISSITWKMMKKKNGKKTSWGFAHLFVLGPALPFDACRLPCASPTPPCCSIFPDLLFLVWAFHGHCLFLSREGVLLMCCAVSWQLCCRKWSWVAALCISPTMAFHLAEDLKQNMVPRAWQTTVLLKMLEKMNLGK